MIRVLIRLIRVIRVPFPQDRQKAPANVRRTFLGHRLTPGADLMSSPFALLFLTAISFGAALSVLPASGADSPYVIVEPGAKLVKLAGGCAFTEGPAADAEGNVYFSDSPNNRIMLLPRGGEMWVWKTGTRGANGMLFDAEGRLITCNSQLAPDGRTVSRYEKDGRVTVLADRYEGKKFNSPNDLAIDSKGRIYFTDPRYGKTDDLEQDRMAVYRIDPGGKVTRVIGDLQVPNGILVTPDDRTLYVADNNPAEGGNRNLVAYDVLPDGQVKRRKVLYDLKTGRGMDGMKLDVAGNIYATAAEGEKSGVYVISPGGKLLDVIKTPENATNCTFGGPDLRTLYITAGGSLYSIRTTNAGWLRYPRQQ
jgi:gluconolactonase